MAPSDSPEFFDRLSTLADPLRCRILLVLEAHELTVKELCAVLQLPQSTVSRHLKTLAAGGWVRPRPEGTRRLYRMTASEADSIARRLWQLTRVEAATTPVAEQDRDRLPAVLAARRRRSREFFAGSAGQWDRLRDELFGNRFHLHAMLLLVEGEPIVADLGCGTGAISETLAPLAGRVIAVDDEASMLDAARRRLAGLPNVELREAKLESLPLDDASVDLATLILVLHHLPSPEKVLGEVARVLKPSGRLLVVDMLPHQRREYQREMGHVWMGFSRRQIERLHEACGLRTTSFRTLPPEEAARGPALFAATARSRVAAEGGGSVPPRRPATAGIS